jgi:Rrf2 family protein
MISQKTRYALRALLHLVEFGGGDPVQLATIAGAQQVPRKYLELIMLDLKRAGFVSSVRGPSGGYRLARTPEDISFGEVIRTLEGPIALVPCASVNFYAKCGDCHDEATCAIRRVMLIVRDQSAQILDNMSLAQAAGFEAVAERRKVSE